MGDYKFKRSLLCEKIREEKSKSRKEQKRHVENYMLSLVRNEESAIQQVKKAATEFCSQFYAKMQKSCSNFDLLQSRFSVWLNGDVTIEDKEKSENRGRPVLDFDEVSERAKRLKTEHVRENSSGSFLLYAASMKFREEGNGQCAKLLKTIYDDPQISEQLLTILKENRKNSNKLSGQEALSLLLDADLGKSQYQIIRTCAKEHGADIFPPYGVVLAEKKSIFPMNEVIVTESSAEVRLQTLVDHDAKQVVSVIEKSEIEKLENLENGACLELHHKWGTDGSGDHSEYQQTFENAPQTNDRCVLLTAISALQLRYVVNDMPPLVLWKNPTPSSVRFCKPIKLQFVKETEETLKQEENYVISQVDALTPTKITTTSGKSLEVHHKFSMTMIDGKTRKILTDTASYSRCTACNAVPNEMKVLTVLNRPVDDSTFKYGLSVLHARIRFLELVLHVSYRLEVKKWQINEKHILDRKQEIIKQLREELGILVDTVKHGSGTTNTGNTARRVFGNLSAVARITGFNEELLKKFGIILDVLCCWFEVATDAFHQYCLQAAKEFDTLYPWFKMPSSVHLVLIHGADIMNSFELPMGAYSEEALEARNKNIRAFRECRTRKCSRTASLYDLFGRLILTGDILLSSLRLRRFRDPEVVPEHIAFLLKTTHAEIC